MGRRAGKVKDRRPNHSAMVYMFAFDIHLILANTKMYYFVTVTNVHCAYAWFTYSTTMWVRLEPVTYWLQIQLAKDTGL